jgi:putative ABC transport system permease protein
MLKNYLKIAFRNILRHKAYSLINVSGLAIGMASSILILLWVQNELSYDRFHQNADQIYRITVEASGFKAAVNPAGMPAVLQAEIPLIKNTVRFSHQSSILLEADNRKFEEKRVFYADSTFLQVFSFPLEKGDPKTALQRIDGILITHEMAKKYFGDQDALGKALRKDNGEFVTVTGILADIPSNSHIQFDFILPMSSLARENNDLKTNTWNSFNFYTYIQMDKGFIPSPQSIAQVEGQMNEIFKKHAMAGLKASFTMQPLTKIHLQSGLQVDLPGYGNIQYVNIFLLWLA